MTILRWGAVSEPRADSNLQERARAVGVILSGAGRGRSTW
jgi:hypothetical protein